MLLLAALLAGLPARLNAAPVTVAHAQGQVTLANAPQKVLVFDLPSLDTLDRLGVRVSGAPSGIMPGSLSKYAGPDYAKIGTLFEPDYEAVNAAAPDLIIVGGRSAAKYSALAQIAPTIDLTIESNGFMAAVERNVLTLGRIFGKEAEAQAELGKLRAAMDAVKMKAAGKGSGLLILTTGGKISAYGPGSRFGMLHDAMGVKPAAADLNAGAHGQPISFEYILKVDPDWLFVIDRDAAIGRNSGGGKQVLDNELIRQTAAARNGRIVFLDPANWYLIGGGLGALQASVEEISNALDKPR